LKATKSVAENELDDLPGDDERHQQLQEVESSNGGGRRERRW
jgi:hypothetical protein